ncbi:ABC transporter substrate-binding protein [Siccirubricoccus deserti]
MRRALNHAIDKNTLIRRVMFGYATISAAPCHIDITGCDIGRDPYPYDPKKARALLEEAISTSRALTASGARHLVAPRRARKWRKRWPSTSIRSA